ncbi:MAG: 2-dehydro-3-deoxyphosphooctonate aldolase [Flavobacterium sp.]
MKKYNFVLCSVLTVLLISCVSTKSTLQNIDNKAIKPIVVNNQFILTDNAPDGKYGYDKNYPINLGFENEKFATKNIALFFNSLAGPEGEKITYDKVETCCPFPTKRNIMGVGTLDIYNVLIDGNTKPLVLYINIYEKSKVLCPKGFSIKKLN